MRWHEQIFHILTTASQIPQQFENWNSLKFIILNPLYEIIKKILILSERQLFLNILLTDIRIVNLFQNDHFVLLVLLSLNSGSKNNQKQLSMAFVDAHCLNS